MGLRQSRGGVLLRQITRATPAAEGSSRGGPGAAATTRDRHGRPASLSAPGPEPIYRTTTSGDGSGCGAAAASASSLSFDSLEAVLSSASFKAMGTMNTVAVHEPAVLTDAVEIAREQIAQIDATCSRFRPDSELNRVNRAAGHGAIGISPLLEQALVAALSAAEMTGGLVDLTVGKNVEDTGYVVTFSAVPADGPPVEVAVREVLGWRAVRLDLARHSVLIPEGVTLDLGASGKAWAADRSAKAASDALGEAVLVECGGDVAVHGEVPGGWPVRVALDEGAALSEDVLIHDGGLATSGTTVRRWRRGGVEVHDIIDPRTGRPATTPWAMVTVAAASCLEANAASTAALILGPDAGAWLDANGLPARLVGRDGTVKYAGGWAA